MEGRALVGGNTWEDAGVLGDLLELFGQDAHATVCSLWRADGLRSHGAGA